MTLPQPELRPAMQSMRSVSDLGNGQGRRPVKTAYLRAAVPNTNNGMERQTRIRGDERRSYTARTSVGAALIAANPTTRG